MGIHGTRQIYRVLRIVNPQQGLATKTLIDFAQKTPVPATYVGQTFKSPFSED